MNRRTGATLVELLVVVTVLGIALAVVAYATGPTVVAERRLGQDASARLRAAALASGRDSSLVVADPRGAILLTAYRDGRTVADTMLSPTEYRHVAP